MDARYGMHLQRAPAFLEAQRLLEARRLAEERRALLDSNASTERILQQYQQSVVSNELETTVCNDWIKALWAGSQG